MNTTPTNNKRPRFGIISGAGPMTGISLLKQTIQLFQKNGAWKDADFPEIHFINFPFSEMLEDNFNKEQVHKELDQCLAELQERCDHIIIACNTLHLFLPDRKIPQLINLVELIKKRLPANANPLVVASMTSSKKNLHGQLLNTSCEYWNPSQSQNMINEILKGKEIDLQWLHNLAINRLIILGCTEFSLAMEDSDEITNIIDPIKIAAQTVFDLSRKSTNFLQKQ